MLDLQTIQLRLDQRGRFLLFETKLGSPMDRAAKLDYAGDDRVVRLNVHLRAVPAAVCRFPSANRYAVIPADLALALLINRTTQAYGTNVPPYIVYREETHVSVPSFGRSQEIDRSVVARNSDGEAVMQDLPAGEQRIGSAYPIIPYFDPFSNYSWSWSAPNPKSIFISLQRGTPTTYATPAPDPGVDAVVPYHSLWDVRYADDSRPDRLHFLIDPTPRLTDNPQCQEPNHCDYPSDIVEDPQTHLPSHVVIRENNTDQVISLDYGTVDGHWVITHGTFSATEHALMFSFAVLVDVTYNNFSFPTSPPPGIAQLPPPSPNPTASP